MSFSLRRDLITRPIYAWAHKALPPMSDTEREALEAGDVWWDADLFTGNPDWSKLLAFAPAKLTDEETAFLNGPVKQLCAMVDEWKVNWEWRDLPPEVWDFIKRNKFLGMIIPKDYGGLGFSPYAHSEVVRKISSRSVTAAVTVMVPNSLGPGELLMHFGTDEQRNKWLPGLAEGREIPCFGLTSPEAGSDAASMIDTGIICKGTFNGKETLGLRLNWHKRYITLGPVATLLGLAFKAYDPDHLIGSEDELGITVALIPTDLPGVTIGHRHLPAMQVFQNGPNWGKDVFIPMDFIIGGQERIGQGWKMLMTALAAGRGISLPSQSSAGAAYCARATGAYARIREQFHVPIAKFEGIEEPLARIAGTAYQLDAARRLTCGALNQGIHPAVISGIMKLHATERLRIVVDDAMDIHGGKAVIDGPQNYMGNLYRSVPVAITVEGANILTRNLIVFGQGSVLGGFFDGLGGVEDFKAFFFGDRARFAAGVEADDDFDAGVLEVESVGVSLGTEADDGAGFAFKGVEVGVFVCVDFGGHIWLWLERWGAYWRRETATLPVRVRSLIPNGSIRKRNFSILLSLPVSSMATFLGCTSMILARKMSQICITSERDCALTLTRRRTSSRSTYSLSRKSSISMTSISLLSCLVTCSSTASSPMTTMVIRERLGSRVGPTLRVSMLNPRPLNIPAMRVSTPNLFSTKTERV